MNEYLVRRAVRELLLSEENELVSNLTFQGNPRSIHQITISKITPPTGYYFINVDVENARMSTRDGFGRTTSVPPSQVVYSLSIEISDYALANYDEEYPFEKMDIDFQRFTDRIVDKLRSSYRITDNPTNKSFVLNDSREVSKVNLSTSWDEASQYHALLYSRITFQLIDECSDNSNLY